MNWLDYILIALLLLSVISSARKGFSREIIGLAAALMALVLGMWFYGSAGSIVAPYTASTRIANLIGFLLVVFAVLICGAILGRIVNRFLRTIGLSLFDRFLGALFGLVRGVLVLMALLTALMAFGPYLESETTGFSLKGAMVHSQIAPYVMEASRRFVAIAPMELKSGFQNQYSAVKSALSKSQEKQ